MGQEIHGPNCLWIGYCSCGEGTPHWVTSPGETTTDPPSPLAPPRTNTARPRGVRPSLSISPKTCCGEKEIVELIEHTQRKGEISSFFLRSPYIKNIKMLEKYHGTAWFSQPPNGISLSFWGEGGTAYYQAYHLRALKQCRSPSPHQGPSLRHT